MVLACISLAALIVMVLHSVVNGALFAVLNRGEPLGPGGFRLFLPSAHPVSLIVSTVVSGFLLGGMIRMANRQIRGGKPRLEDLLTITDCWFDLLLAAFLILPRWIYMATLEHTEPRYLVEFFPFLSVLGGIAISRFFGANQISAPEDRIGRVKDPDMEAIIGRLSPLSPGVASS